MDLDFKLGTDGGELSDEDVPLATGDESPGVLDLPNEIGIGLRNPAQLFHFGESAAQAVEPAQYADYQQGKAAAERRLDIDIDDDLIAQLEGDASVSVSTRGDVGVRIELADEAKFSDTLEKLEKELPKLISSTGGSPTRLTRAGDVTVLRSADGDSLAYQVEDGAILLSNEPARVKLLAGRDPEGRRGRQGRAGGERRRSGAVPRGATQPRRQPRRRRPRRALGGQIIADPLDELTGSVRAGKDGLTGKLTLTFD